MIAKHHIVRNLNSKQIIVYPTESVFGIGCDPDSEFAVNNLLKLKKRSWRKGLILVAAYYEQFLKYIDANSIDKSIESLMLSYWPGNTTFVVPANPMVPYWIKGKHKTIAIRITNCELIRDICLSFGKPLISTSANISGLSPARNVCEVYKQFGYNILTITEEIKDKKNPSEIRDALSNKIIRHG